MHTPWGKSDYSERHGNGITFFGTPSHGGFHVAADLNAKMPGALRQDSGWYEEDCECCKVILAFPLRFTPAQVETAVETFRNWFPENYERFYDVILQPGQSYIRDQQTFRNENAANWVVVAAWGDWKEGVTKGFCGVVATLGESRSPGVQHRYFLVPTEEYDARAGGNGFVIDVTRHQETDEHFKPVETESSYVSQGDDPAAQRFVKAVASM